MKYCTVVVTFSLRLTNTEGSGRQRQPIAVHTYGSRRTVDQGAQAMPGGWERLLDRDVLSQREHGCPVATARENREVFTKSAAEKGRQLSVVKERAGEGLSKRPEGGKGGAKAAY